MYLGGVSENAVAKHFGVSRAPIQRILAELGVQRRSQSESESLKWSQMTSAQRARQVAPAHRASTGRIRSLEEQCRTAQTRECRKTHVSPLENALCRRLRKHGLKPIQQKAIGPYNCDLAIHPVAVEVFGGHWHWYGQHRRIFEKRCRYILNAGWSVYILPISVNDPLSESRVSDLIAYLEAARRNPPSACEYRVVWSAGEWEVRGTINNHEIAIDPPFTHAKDPATGQYIRVRR